MADNTDEDDIGNPINNQSENSPDQIILTKDIENITPNQETENMEVHHHAHDPAAPHHKKNWKSYFWEFLMLFLAVTLGFFAENQREHYIENERMHRYLESMLLDIESNQEVLDSAIRQNTKMIATYDSLATYLSENTQTIDRGAFARKLGAIWYRGFINRHETFEQMKTSGSLRYIKNFVLLTTILDYERKCNFAQYRTEHFEQKYYTEIFLPAIYRNYDMPCLYLLDSAYSNKSETLINNLKHVDIISGAEAKKFRQEVGSAFMLRLERMRTSAIAYRIATYKGEELTKLIEKELD